MSGPPAEEGEEPVRDLVVRQEDAPGESEADDERRDVAQPSREEARVASYVRRGVVREEEVAPP